MVESLIKMPKKTKTMNKSTIYYLFFATLFVCGCSNLKYLPEGDALYVGGSVKVEDTAM